MVGNLITSLRSLLPSIAAVAAQALSSTSSNSNNSQKERAQAVKEDLETLMLTLEQIKATLYDAEQRDITDRSVKLWLKDLKKVAHASEDVLSEYQYEVTRAQVEARKASEASGLHKRKQMEYIEYNVQISDGMVGRLKEIRDRFDKIAKLREALQLTENDGARRLNNKFSRPPTGHMVDEASIFGRDAEIEQVIDSLLSEKEKPFSVISIVGKGGLGKTTIAQLVYNDGRVSRCFALKGWVYVSEEFDVRRLIKGTIESFSKTNCGLSELSQLQEELANIVKGKTILLVLDDVWNENHNLWESFRVPFKEARMVRILVTTRNKNVAKVMQTTTCFNPSNLSEDSCWQLFQHAFSGTSYTMPIHLVDMGREITRKCGGLPLAVKSIASLLRHEADEEVWREILQSDLWEIKESKEVIFPALQISYAHLPAHLKPCFLFCSMYPKDYKLPKEDLIKLWIAHGYVTSRSNRKIVEIGVEYWNELKERSFLDATTYSYSKESCKLHDIIHDLARLSSENEHYSVEINHPLDIQERTVPREAYHLYVRGSMGYVNQIPQQTMKGLRTIFMDIQECNRDFEDEYCTKAIDQNLELTEDCEDCLGDVTLCNLTQFEVLRVLIVKWDSLTKIPHSISELKHLTYLSISSKRLKILPLSIGLLYNLLALEANCESLEYLPENIGDLANLRLLTIISPFLRKLPKSLCSLTNLLELTIESRFLDYVPHSIVNFPSITKVKACWNVRTIGWLKDMKDLTGKISVGRLKNINNLEDAKRANMRNKCKLEILELYWNGAFYIPDIVDSRLELNLIPEACEGGIVGAEDVHFSLVECLQPHPNLKRLRVEGYPSAIVPGWMRDPLLLKSIQELRLKSCGYIESLPFGNLHTLKYLYIKECSSIRTIQLEQLPSQLKVLEIARCEYLELITGLGHLDGLQLVESPKSLGSLTNLRKLAIGGLFVNYVPHDLVNFPSLTKVSAMFNVRTIGWLKDMKDLEGMISFQRLKNINNLEDAKRANLRNKCKLEILELCWDDRFLTFDSMESLLELDLVPEPCEGGIVGTNDLHFSLLECLQPHPNLKKLGVKGYPSAIVPGWMRDPLLLKSIQELRLESCGYIESLPFGNLHTLKYLKITKCSSIRTMQLEQLPTQLETLEISFCDHLELITLKSITMDGLQLVESTEPFSDSSYEIPHINRQSISSLTKLKIEHCHLLHSLPDGLIPSGPCDVRVQYCGCPSYYKSIEESSISDISDSDGGEDHDNGRDEGGDDGSDDDKSNQGTSSSHHTSMSNMEDDVEDEGEDDDSDDDKSNQEPPPRPSIEFNLLSSFRPQESPPGPFIEMNLLSSFRP